MFMHRYSWIICPYHSLACNIIVNTSIDGLYSHIPIKGESQYVNNLLTTLYERYTVLNGHILTPDLKSHSSRHGATTTANEHPDIQTTWLINRRGWSLSKGEQIFNYIAGTVKNDSRVARVLSDWPQPNYGGNAITIDAVPILDRNLFKYFAVSLLGSANFNLVFRDRIQICLCCVLLLYYEEVSISYPNSLVIHRIHEVKYQCGIEDNKFFDWCKSIKDYWNNQNSIYLSIDSNNNASTRNNQDQSLYSKIEDIRHFSSNVDQRTSSINIDCNVIKEVVNQLNNKIDGMYSSLLALHSMINNSNQNVNINNNNTINNTTINHSRSLITSYFTPTAISAIPNNNSALPIDLIESRKKLSVKSFFLRWYDEELYKREVTDANKAVINRFIIGICYLRYFLPNNTTINPRPTELSDYIQWKEKMIGLSKVVEESAIRFCYTHRVIDNNDNATRKRQKTITTYFEGVYRRFSLIEINKFVLPQNVLDRASIPTGRPAHMYFFITDFRH